MKIRVVLLTVATGFLLALFIYNVVHAGQTTTTIRPSSTVNGGWTGAGTADNSCTGNCMRVDEASTNDNTDYAQAQAAANDEYGMQDVNADAQRATNILLRVRMTRQSSESCFLGSPQNVPLQIGIRLNGGSLQTVSKTVAGSNGTYAWYEENFSGSFTQSDINSLQTYIAKANAPSCGFGITQAVFRVSMVEAVITWQTPEFDQSASRVYANQNSVQPGVSLAATNALADVQQNSQFRIRAGITNSHTDWLSGAWGDHSNQYKLQYAARTAGSCAAQATGWGDVLSGSGPIRWYDNPGVADNATISSYVNDPTVSGSPTHQVYRESNPFSNSTQINVGNTGLWDFSLVSSSSPYGTVYCFRIVKSNGSLINNYTQYPSIVITGSLDVDVVNSSGVSVASPSMPFGSVLVIDSCQSTTGTLGLASQVVRVTNNIATNGWSLSIAATGGPTAFWSNGSTGSYDYNDSGGSPNGCSDGGDADNRAGRLTVSPNTGSLAPQSGCSGTGTSLGTPASFVEGSVNSITLATASSATPRFCYFSLTGVGLAQQIPEWRPKGSYSLDFTLTVLAL